MSKFEVSSPATWINQKTFVVPKADGDEGMKYTRHMSDEPEEKNKTPKKIKKSQTQNSTYGTCP